MRAEMTHFTFCVDWLPTVRICRCIFEENRVVLAVVGVLRGEKTGVRLHNHFAHVRTVQSQLKKAVNRLVNCAGHTLSAMGTHPLTASILQHRAGQSTVSAPE